MFSIKFVKYAEEIFSVFKLRKKLKIADKIFCVRPFSSTAKISETFSYF